MLAGMTGGPRPPSPHVQRLADRIPAPEKPPFAAGNEDLTPFAVSRWDAAWDEAYILVERARHG